LLYYVNQLEEKKSFRLRLLLLPYAVPPSVADLDGICFASGGSVQAKTCRTGYIFECLLLLPFLDGLSAGSR